MVREPGEKSSRRKQQGLMLNVYRVENGVLKCAPAGAGPAGALWFDLLDPTPEESKSVGDLLGVEMPTRVDMEEIEVSSRLYRKNDAAFMTALVLANSDSDHPSVDVVTFVLVRGVLVTIRFIDPQPFQTFVARCGRGTVTATTAEDVLLALLDVIVDRMADVLERIGADVEAVSRRVFNADTKASLGSRDSQEVLRTLGRKNDVTGKARESLLTVARLLSFLAQAIDAGPSKEESAHVKTLTRDIQSLQEHSNYLSGKLSYLLDATLGLINIDQNNIIKIMSVAAIVFLPPTLIASIEGMNFKFMPELSSPLGYPISIALMVLSAIVPYLWFKRRGWL
jgi:magnesium transporter